MVKKEVHIIGAGCSGLSLAKYLSMENYANAYQINVYGEKSKAFEKPNYWSFWSGEISPSIDQVIKKKMVSMANHKRRMYGPSQNKQVTILHHK